MFLTDKVIKVGDALPLLINFGSLSDRLGKNGIRNADFSASVTHSPGVTRSTW